MSLLKFSGIITSLFLVAVAQPVHAAEGCEDGRITASKQLDFTRSLLEDGEHFRAVGEGRRYLVFFDDCGEVDSARLLVGLSYQRAKQWEEARETFRSLAGSATDATGHMARLAFADTLFRQERYQAAAANYKEFADKVSESSYAAYARYRQGFSELLDRRPVVAKQVFLTVPEGSDVSRHSLQLAEATGGFDDLPSRSPALAGIMSAIIPGAGQAYTGRWVDGSISLLVNAGFGIAAWQAYQNDLPVVAILVGLFELGWYTGNIFSAVNYAHKYNERALEGYQRDLMQRDLVERDWAAETNGQTRYLRFGVDF
jgi:hypothetical protein